MLKKFPSVPSLLIFFFFNHERAAYFLKCYALEMLKEKCYNLLAPGKKEVLAGAKWWNHNKKGKNRGWLLHGPSRRVHWDACPGGGLLDIRAGPSGALWGTGGSRMRISAHIHPWTWDGGKCSCTVRTKHGNYGNDLTSWLIFVHFTRSVSLVLEECW